MTATITRDQARDIGYELELDGDSVRTGYTGRGMYGDTCLGFVTDDDPGQLMFALGKLAGRADMGTHVYGLEGIDWDAFDHCSTDSMGRGTIVYFRSVEVEGGADTEDEEEA